MPKDPKKDNPPAIRGAGQKDEKGNYHGKHTAFGMGSSDTHRSYEGKHAKDADVVDINTKKEKK